MIKPRRIVHNPQRNYWGADLYSGTLYERMISRISSLNTRTMASDRFSLWELDRDMNKDRRICGFYTCDEICIGFLKVPKGITMWIDLDTVCSLFCIDYITTFTEDVIRERFEAKGNKSPS